MRVTAVVPTGFTSHVLEVCQGPQDGTLAVALDFIADTDEEILRVILSAEALNRVISAIRDARGILEQLNVELNSGQMPSL